MGAMGETHTRFPFLQASQGPDRLGFPSGSSSKARRAAMIGDAYMHAMLAAALSAEPPEPELRVRRVPADTAKDEARARWDMILQQPVTKRWHFGRGTHMSGLPFTASAVHDYEWTEFHFGHRSGPPGFPPPGSPAGEAAPKVACRKLWDRMLPWEKGQSFKEAIAAVADVNHLSFWLDRLRLKRYLPKDTYAVTTGYVLHRLSYLDPDKYTDMYINWLFADTRKTMTVLHAAIDTGRIKHGGEPAEEALCRQLDNWKEVARIGDKNYKGAEFVKLMPMAVRYIVRISKLLGQDCAEYEERLNSEFPPGEAATTEPPAGAKTGLPVV